MFVYLSGNKSALGITVRRLVIEDPVTAIIGGPELLFLLVYVVRNYRVSRVEDGLRRPIVLLEQDDFCSWKMLLKFKNVTNIGLPKSVDTLGVVTDHADVLLLLGQKHYQRKLQRIRVLVFVNEDVLVSVVVFLTNF